ARLLSTLDAGPVIIVTSGNGADRAAARRALEARGAEIVGTDGPIAAALRVLGARRIGSLLLEGGAGAHARASDAHVVACGGLYATRRVLGCGVALLPQRNFSSATLFDRRVEAVGDDVLIEGYVHRPR